jgi:chaperone required for assembly of F1-ATPase
MRLDLRKGFHEPAEKPRRFYKAVAVEPVDPKSDGGGFGVMLDGRRLRTPKARPLVLPTQAAADQVAAEWAAQVDVIEMATMHATRLANTAIETIGGSREGVADQIVQYAGADLLCYFAEAPAELTARQAAAWGPVLARAEAELSLRFERCVGILHRDQPGETLAKVRAIALEEDDFALAGLAFGVALFGSAVLAIAVRKGWLGGAEAFDLSRVDEAFQEEKWGIDSEAAERTERLRGEAAMLEQWFKALGA